MRRLAVLPAVISVLAATSLQPATAAQQRVYGVVGSSMQVSLDSDSGNVHPAANVRISVTRTPTATGTLTTVIPQS